MSTATVPRSNPRSNPARFTAIAVIAGIGYLAAPPTHTKEECAQLASRFRFTRTALPKLHSRPAVDILPVNPAVAHVQAFFSAVLGGAVTLRDIDGDGLPNDVCYTEIRSRDVIVTGVPGTPERFAPFTLDAGALFDEHWMVPTTCAAGDFNEDGLTDLLVSYEGRTPVLFLRRLAADGSPVPLSMQAFEVRELEPGSKEIWNTSTTLITDLDGDGHMDILVGNNWPDGARIFDVHAPDLGTLQMPDSLSHARNAGENQLFLWKEGTSGASPTARFERAHDVFPGDDARGWTLALGAADLDKDGLNELYVANDFGPDSLYLNRSTPGHMKLVPLFGAKNPGVPRSKCVGHDSFKGMGIDFSDVNGDGYFDMFVSNMTATWGVMEGHFLWMSTPDHGAFERGEAPFEDKSEELTISRSSWAWDTRFGDFDNDGTDEALQANGLIRGSVNRWARFQDSGFGNDNIMHDPAIWPRLERGDDISGDATNGFWVRGEGGRFADIGKEVGTGGPWNTRGIATADVDGDGKLDIAYGNMWEDAQYFHNEAPSPGRFVALHILLPLREGEPRPTSVRDGHPASRLDGFPAIGTFVTLHPPDGRAMIRQVDGSSGHTGAHSPEVHFGLGSINGDAVMAADLTWRDLDGRVHRENISVKPGWHTVLLGTAQGGAR